MEPSSPVESDVSEPDWPDFRICCTELGELKVMNFRASKRSFCFVEQERIVSTRMTV